MFRTKYAIYCWAVLAYTLAVILWGAYVRASGSGAGCGSHWPLCNGVVIPRDPQAATRIEFAHRVSSGLLLPLVAGLLLGAIRTYARGHQVRAGAWAVLAFTITESLIGAGLVLLGLVAENSSLWRALALALHLLNTFLLLGALTLSAWWASGGAPMRLRGQALVGWTLALALVGVLLLGMSGAVAALGDTLFPAASFADGLRQEFAASSHTLLRWRLLHPLLAGAVSIHLVLAANLVRQRRPGLPTTHLTRALTLLLALQIAAGAVNALLLAPVWMQIVHLLLADTVWITLVLLSAVAFASAPVAAEVPQAAGAHRRSVIS